MPQPALLVRLPQLLERPRQPMQRRHREQLITAMINETHLALFTDLIGWLLVVMHTMQRSTTELVGILLERHEAKHGPVLERQTTTLLIVSLLETPTNQLLLRRPFPQLRQDHTLQLFSEIRTNDPTLKRRIPPLIRSQPLRQTPQIDRLDQIVTDPRRRLPRPVPTKKHLQRFPTRMELNLLHMRHIPQQRIRAHLPFDRRQDLRDAHTLPRRQ